MNHLKKMTLIFSLLVVTGFTSFSYNTEAKSTERFTQEQRNYFKSINTTTSLLTATMNTRNFFMSGEFVSAHQEVNDSEITLTVHTTRCTSVFKGNLNGNLTEQSQRCNDNDNTL